LINLVYPKISLISRIEIKRLKLRGI
jgi:hypothetical protein